MKFGKEFQQILDESKFPDEWKSSAIEYRQLKKLIKDVVSELSSMGLSPDVLHRLLTTDDDSSGTSTPLEIASNAAAGPSTAPAPQPISQRQIATEPSHVHAQQDGDDEVLEFEFESDEASPPTFGTSSTPGAGPSHGARPGVNGGSRHNIVKLASGVRRGYVRDPLLDDADVGNEGDHEGARGDTDSFGTSYSSNGGGESHPSSLHESGHNRRHSSFSRTRNFRVRLLSDTNPSSPDQTLNAGSSRGSRTQRSADNGKDEIAPHARARTEPTPIRPFGVADMLRTQYGDQEDLTPPLGASNGFQRPGSADGQCVGKSSAFGVGEHSHRRTVRRSMNQGGVRAQYVFAGDSSHPEPQLRFHLPPRPSPSSSSSRSTSPNPSGPSDSASTDDDAAGSGSGFGSHGASGEGEGEEDMEDLTTLPIPAPVPLRSHGHTRRHGGSGSLTSSPATIKAGYKSPFLVPAIGISSPSMLPGSASKGKGTQMPIPQSPTLQRLNMVRSPIFALATGSGTGSGSPGLRTQGQGKKGSGPESGSPKMDGEGLRDFDLGEAAVDGLDEVEGDRYQISLDDGTKGSNGAVGEVEGCTETCPAHPASTSPDRRPLSVLPSVGAADAGSASPSSTAIATVAAPAEVAPAAVPQTLITPPSPRHNHTHSHHNGHANGRDIIVPLSSDRAFFDLLTAALTSLSVFHAAQQVAFRDAVEKLCRMISNSIVPQGSSVQIMPIPPVPSSSSPSPSAHSGLVTTHGIQRPPQELLSRRINKLHKKDLYAWREIFTLWIEAEIFESSAERTRGERTVEEAEKRLQAFAHEVVKRGLGDRRTFRGKKTREAWEEFLRLNVLLLDLKRFQLANINAARKILKKHDKRTALTASSGFQSLARATLSKIGADGSVSTWTFYNTSLPHVLLASLTDILLPILPSLDDYACLICTSIAFKPIRLSCQHLFCVRCLVKMQRKGQAECPLCRSPTVLLADKSSLDVQIMGVQDATRRTKLIDRFMRDWFPREVKAKQRENDEEIADEIRAEERGESPDCVVM